MFSKIIQQIKKEPLNGLYTVFAASLIMLFTSLFSLCILQADDYYYAAFFKNGLGEFIRLSIDHFQSINGRALVHFFLQLALALPKMFLVLINSAILFSIGFFSFKLSRFHESNNHGVLYLIMFYSLIMLSGSNTLKEAIMWASGFYNYVFPAFITFAALYLCKKNNPLGCLLCFFAGATTEQWGITAVVMLTVYHILNARNSKEMKNPAGYLPSLAALAGYITIFASPATISRIFVSGHTELTASLFDISRLAKAFFSKGSCIAVIAVFILVTVLTAFIKKGVFSVLYSGFLPLALILLLPFHGSYMAVLIVFLCYLLLCAALFYKEKHPAAIFLFGALTSIIVMLPTNTYDARITFPGALLMGISTILIFSDIQSGKRLIVSTFTLLLSASIVFAPSYMGFYKNSLIEKNNLDAIKEAKQTKILNYCIDYDKAYAMRQMFNDGWFYQTFLSLYDLEDCTVYPYSVNSKPLYYNGAKLKSEALMYQGEAYVPLRAFLNEAGGKVTEENGTIFELDGKTLTYLDGIFMYTNPEGHEKYLIADNNKLLDFYTLYIKLNVAADAFNVNISTK